MIYFNDLPVNTEVLNDNYAESHLCCPKCHNTKDNRFIFDKAKNVLICKDCWYKNDSNEFYI